MAGSAAERREAQRVADAFAVALTQLGADALLESLSLWQDVAPQRGTPTGARWLTRAMQLVSRRRREARDLAWAYYRLQRALHTGYTVRHPDLDRERNVTISQLRERFWEQVEDHARVADQPVPERYDAPGIEREVPTEILPNISDLEERLERESQEEAEIVLDALGPQKMEKELESLEDERTPMSKADKQRLKAHRKAGARQAAAAERLVLNGGRGTVWTASNADRRVIGYVRVSQTGTPCGWCAMLMSRGAVYRSKRSAERDYNDGDLYHDNCWCVAEPVYSREQYDKDPRFDLNRKYAAEWPKVTRGLGGKDAISAWRRHIRESSKSPGDSS